MTSRQVPYVAVVRRGETEVFRTLRDRVAELALADVIWDRRMQERRTATADTRALERRRHDRRGLPPISWGPLGFALTTPGGPESWLARGTELNPPGARP